ncbi:MAG: SPOR domain-containing protein [Candidatus Dojkabacteria bacterium]
MQFLRTNQKTILKVLGILLIASLLIFIVAYLLDSNPDINEFEVTNLSSNSFSISWSSESANIPSVQYSDSDNWLPLVDKILTKNVAYDDRDVNLDSQNNAYYAGDKAKARNFHQVTLRNLEAGKKYYFRINGSVRTYIPIPENSVTTLAQADKVNQPDTAYGKIVNFTTNEPNPSDGIVYYRFVDSYDEEDVSALYSSAIGSGGVWSGDFSNLHTEYGDTFGWDKENYTISMEVRSDIGYGWTNLKLTEYKPLENAVINVRYIPESAASTSSDNATASADSGVLGLTTDLAINDNGGGVTKPAAAQQKKIDPPSTASTNKPKPATSTSEQQPKPAPITGTAKLAQGLPSKPAPAVVPKPAPAGNTTNSSTTTDTTKPVVNQTFGNTSIVNNKPICNSAYSEACGNGCKRNVTCGAGGSFNVGPCTCVGQANTTVTSATQQTCPVATIWNGKNCQGTAVGTPDATKSTKPIVGGGDVVATKPEKATDPKTRTEANKQVPAGSAGSGASTGIAALAQGKITSCDKVTNIVCPAVSCVGLNQSVIGTQSDKSDGNVRCSYSTTSIPVSVGTCKDVAGTPTFSQFLSADNQAAICGDSPVVDKCTDLLKTYNCPGGTTCSNGDTTDVRQTTSGSSVICEYKTTHAGGATSGITKVGATCNNNNLITNPIDVKAQACTSLKDTTTNIPVEKDNGTTVGPSACNSDVLSGKYANQGIHCYDDNVGHPGTQRCKGAVSIKWCDPAPTSSLIDSPLFPVKIVHAQPVPDVLDPALLSKGTYSIVIPGFKNAEFSVLNNNVTVKYFDDINSDGIKESNEPYIDPTQYTVTLAKLSDLSAYELNAGWNLIALNFASADFTKASDLIKSINNQGVAAVQISKYDSGNWIHFVYRLNEQGAIESFGNDFTLIPGEGYFVRTLDNGIVQFKGQKFTSSVPINLSTGWNLAAILSTIDYTANSFITKCNTLGAECTTISRFTDNTYESVVKLNNQFFGNNFDLKDTEGYFVLNKSANKTISP